MTKKAGWLFLLLAVAHSLIAQAKPQPLEAADIKVLYYQKIPMRDGVNLSTNIFMPEVMKEPLPAIMVLTPYTNDHNTQRGIYFATNGYVFVSVDSRGRGNSEGIFTPFENEGKDGCDAIEWIARQPWCNGKVGTMGGSYKGMVQWLIAKNAPPHLVSMSPTATVCPGIDAAGDRNIFRTYNLNILSYVAGRTLNPRNFFSAYNTGKIARYYRENTAYAQLLDALASPPENHLRNVFKTWIAHPAFDGYWKDMLPAKADFERIKIPILTITGYFDDDQPGTMYYYNGYQQCAPEEFRAKNYFVIGPWDHGGTRKPVAELGGMKFGDKAVIDIFELHKQWFDWTIKGGGKPAFLKDRVAYFAMGPNEWRYCPSIGSMANATTTYYLSSPGLNPVDVFHSGELQAKPAPGRDVDSLAYDPLKHADKDKGIANDENYLTSQAYVNEEGWLYYHTPALTEDAEISGFISLCAFVALDAPDTDFYFKLYELKPDGTNVNLGNGVMRARFRNSLEKEELVKPGAVNEYRFQSLNMINSRIGKGSRLRLLVGYLDSPNYQRNYNSGKDVSFETAKDARTVNIKLYSGKKYPSRIEIPVLK